MGKYLLPVQLGMNRIVKGISSAEWANCAVLDNGQVKCWGQNAGQLGTSAVSDVGDGPGEMDALGSVDLGVGRSAKSVSLAATHACAVLDNASLKCWGAGKYGALGQDEAVDRPSPASLMPVNVGAGRTVQTVSASNGQSCALLDNGSAKCWGNGYFGSLSVSVSVVDLGDVDGYYYAIGDVPGEMELLPGLSFGNGHTAKSIVGGTNATCAILDDNSVRCWGADYRGEIGQESDQFISLDYIGKSPTELAALPAVNLGTARTAKMLSFGYSHVCAVLDNGSVKCWGGNESGQLGVGNTSDQGNDPGEMGDALKAVPLGPGRTAHFVATGQSHSCAILDNGTVVCWGLNDKGQLGLGNVTSVGDAGGLAGVSLTAVDLSF
jgi:alpha-tubulin suppressor-like RCC1 family protein